MHDTVTIGNFRLKEKPKMRDTVTIGNFRLKEKPKMRGDAVVTVL